MGCGQQTLGKVASLRTSGGSTLLQAVGLLIVLSCAAGAGAIDLASFANAEVGREEVTEAANAVAAMSAEEARGAERTWRARIAAQDEQPVLNWMLAILLERAGNLQRAREIYQRLIDVAPGTPYAASAAFRERVVALPPPQTRAALERIVCEPATEGWFRFGDHWSWDTSRRAAAAELASQRGDWLSWRCFKFLGAYSPFPPTSAYVFVLFVVAIGMRALQLPLVVASRWTQGERPPIPDAEQQRRLRETRSRRALIFTELLFAAIGLWVVSGFLPQLILDGASLMDGVDATEPAKMSIVFLLVLPVTAWVVMLLRLARRDSITLKVLFPKSMGSRAKSTLSDYLLGTLSLLLAAAGLGAVVYWRCPAYWLVFVGFVTLSAFPAFVLQGTRGVGESNRNPSVLPKRRWDWVRRLLRR